ncbi:uncharacterized protein N7511_009567 [Penicillium nucicola]|uniref:uncharacterized protein n=1 Tax=Penicillium nucicola TaxID=1850975 RepID=UPI0025452803|nr:uncharacterized protein N7511_009567 [Penicillium nucicola]KAJ5747871.1 hypothetical protein N7511_009567 [Penicillium nucicola]
MNSRQYPQGYKDNGDSAQIDETLVAHEGNEDLSAFLSSICHPGPYVAEQNISDYDKVPDSSFPTSALSYELAGSAEAESLPVTHEQFPFEPHASSSWSYNEEFHTSQLAGPSFSHDPSLSPAFPLPIASVSGGSHGREFENPRPRSTPIWPMSQFIPPQNRQRQELPRRRSRYHIRDTDRGTSPVFIPPNANPAHPLERWKESPPEGEAASLSAIRNALQNPSIYSTGHEEQQDHDSWYSTSNPGVAEQFRHHRATNSRPASITSAETPVSASSRRSDKSGVSNSSRSQHKSTAGVKRNKASGGKKKRMTSATAPRIFCCTFCCDKFKSKYDWVRHEKSLHLNLETWVCAPHGGCVILPSTGRVHCAYCNQLDPSANHLEQHDYSACKRQNRIFKRKDHLIQHLRLAHRLETMPLIDDWKHVVTDFPSRCGFCGGRMSTWDERANHLTLHFREGRNMASWKGDHEFPPEIAAQVTHSVPPYLLDFESRTFVPFSATNRAVSDHLSQMMTRATFSGTEDGQHVSPEAADVDPEPIPESDFQLDSYTQVLTRHLSHYAQQNMMLGVIPSDEMFQLEARRLLFDSEDSWNQTMADNPEWLAKFRSDRYNDSLPQTPDELVNDISRDH